MQPDQSSLLFEADNAVHFVTSRKVSNLTVPKAAFRAVEADRRHGEPRMLQGFND
jgi:hypothetical protein